MYSLALSPDGRTALTGSGDDSAHIFDLASCGPAAHVLRGHSDTVVAVGFSYDGKMAASGALDGSITVRARAYGR